MTGIIEFRAKRQGSGTVDTDLYDVDPLRDAFGRFASGATLHFEDASGTKQSAYPYGQRVDVEYTTDGGSTWNRRFSGVVLDTEPTNRGGLPQVEVDIVGYDHLLRRRKVYKDYSSTTRSAILKDLITNFTSVKWVAGNVDVQNDDTIDLPLRGKRVDEAIDTIASGSTNEEWGVNNDLEFFFRQQSAERAPAVGDADVIDYDLPESGERSINRFKLFYGANGDSFVEVEDREAQQDLKSKLNAPRRVVISDSDTRTEITTEARAEEVARKQLGERSTIQTGTVTVPLGRFNTESGDVLELTISDAGISGEDFRVAQADFNWLRGDVDLTVAENRGSDLDDLLVSLADSLANARAVDADPNATGTRYLDQVSAVELSTTPTLTAKTERSDAFVLGQSQLGRGTDDQLGGGVASTSTATIESKKFTRAALNMCRDVWQGAAATDLAHVGVGSSDEAATRADNNLQAPIERVALDRFGKTSAAEAFEFVAAIPPGGAIADAAALEELMIFDAASGGNGYLRVTFGAVDVDADTRFKIRLACSIDDDADESGVITTTGQQRLRDLFVGETGHHPTDMVYGTGTAAPAESDTTLGNKVHEDTIDETIDGSVGTTDIVERIASGEANGNDLAEIGYENSGNELLARLTFEALSKTSAFALESNYHFAARNA